MEKDDFVKALVSALSSEKVQKSLKHSICDEIIKEVRDLREIVKKKDDHIKNWKNKSMFLSQN